MKIRSVFVLLPYTLQPWKRRISTFMTKSRKESFLDVKMACFLIKEEQQSHSVLDPSKTVNGLRTFVFQLRYFRLKRNAKGKRHGKRHDENVGKRNDSSTRVKSFVGFRL
jgi:hypothetical protein